jgi:hypothetical protein
VSRSSATADSNAVAAALVAVALLWLTHRVLHTEPEPPPGRWPSRGPVMAAVPASAASSARTVNSVGFRPRF